MGTEVTVGIDIGTSSVKAIAADGDGNVVARARVAHEVRVPAPERFEHDAAVAWHDGPLRALAELGDLDVRGVSVAAMVPSLTAVDGTGTPVTPGLLYGDDRGRTGESDGGGGGTDDASGGFLGFVRWLAGEAPGAHGLWPAQAVANHAFERRGGARHDHGRARAPPVRLGRVGRAARAPARDPDGTAAAPRAHRVGGGPHR